MSRSDATPSRSTAGTSRAWTPPAPVSDETINALLDELAGLGQRESQVAFLRGWIAGLMRVWSEQRAEQQRETLGKLGGG
jgi:hypothetical protein